jgi:hypothetical protein
LQNTKSFSAVLVANGLVGGTPTEAKVNLQIILIFISGRGGLNYLFKIHITVDGEEHKRDVCAGKMKKSWMSTLHKI